MHIGKPEFDTQIALELSVRSVEGGRGATKQNKYWTGYSYNGSCAICRVCRHLAKGNDLCDLIWCTRSAMQTIA